MISETIWFVSPSYFDVESWSQLRVELQSVMNTASLRQVSVQYVLVDDSAGQDRAVDGLDSEERVIVIRPPYNLGHQGAIVYGLRELSEKLHDDDVVVTLDADGEDSPTDVPALINALKAMGRSGVSLAQRRKRQESRRFQLGYQFFRLLFLLLTGRSVRTGNFAAQRGGFIRQSIWNPTFDKCYSTSLLAMRRERMFVSADRGRRYAGESRMNFLSLAGHGLRMMLPFSDLVAVRMSLLSLLFVTLGGVGLVSSLFFAGGFEWLACVMMLAVGLVLLIASLILYQSFFQVSLRPGYVRSESPR